MRCQDDNGHDSGVLLWNIWALTNKNDLVNWMDVLINGNVPQVYNIKHPN